MSIIYLFLAIIVVIVGWHILQWLRRPKPVSMVGKVVIITGATTGIGHAAAQAFATAGARVVIAGRRKSLLYELENELKARSADVLAVPTDIRVDTDLEQLVKTVQETFGPIDILVNNAGYARGGAFSSLHPAALHEMLNTNLYGTFRLTQLVLPQMLARRAGQIINISSVTGRIYFPGLAAYSASKSAICSFSNSLRRELAGSGLFVTVILPAGVRTAMIEEAATELDNYSSKFARSPFLQMLIRQIDTPQKTGDLIVNAACYRRREVMMGGPSVSLLVLIENWAAAQMDTVLGWLDTEMLINISSKLHN